MANAHQMLHNRQQGGRKTVVRTIFKTMTPDGFNGDHSAVAWSTIAVDHRPTPTEKPAGKTTSAKLHRPEPSASSLHRGQPKNSHTLPASIAPTSQSLAETLAVASGKQAGAPTRALTASPLPTKTVHPESSDSGNSSSVGGAAKAGIAIGVLGGVLLVFLAIYLLFSRRKKQAGERALEDDEKLNGPFGDSTRAPPPPPAKPPRLSLRPVTQFLSTPAPTHPERRTSRHADLAMAAGAAGSAWERPTTSSSATSANNNPFGSGAQRLDSPRSAKSASPTSPVHGSQHVATAAAAGVAVGMAAAGLARKTSTRKENAPSPLDLTVPPGATSPALTEYSAHSLSPGQSPGPSAGAAAIAAAGGPVHAAVHRVQLDFQPTLDDEMGLKAGQLVRVLHEYDDGWALCIRLDRSQQGVVPRTCLSTRPVKPRPPHGGGPRHGPPVNLNKYPQPGRQGGPRPDSPASVQGRPLSPNSRGPSSPERSGPPTQPVGRKPVPGAAY